MKSQYIPMSIEEFEIIEHPFGWKAEYWDGKAVFTPRECVVTTKLKLTQRYFNQTYCLLPPNSTFKSQMIEAFFESFQDSVEFCNWQMEEIRVESAKNINNYFEGVRGEPLPVSVISLEPNNNLVGLALFTKKCHERIRLDLLFVKPLYQRKGIGTEMVSLAINQLYEAGIRELYSSYHICNEVSRKWHHKFGFEDIYDQFYIRLKYSWYRNELWRHEQLGLNDKIDKLTQERDYWYSQLEDEWKY